MQQKPLTLVTTGINVIKSQLENKAKAPIDEFVPLMSLLKYKLPSKKRIPYTASSAEKNNG